MREPEQMRLLRLADSHITGGSVAGDDEEVRAYHEGCVGKIIGQLAAGATTEAGRTAIRELLETTVRDFSRFLPQLYLPVTVLQGRSPDINIVRESFRRTD